MVKHLNIDVERRDTQRALHMRSQMVPYCLLLLLGLNIIRNVAPEQGSFLKISTVSGAIPVDSDSIGIQF